MTTWWFGRRSCMRKEQIWAVMCNDPVSCHSLLAPLCSNLSCGVGEVRTSCWCRAQTQKFTSSLCLAALPAPLLRNAHNHWCCTCCSCKILTPRTHRCASWDMCRANPAPTKGFTDATAVTDTLMFHKKPMRDRSLMSWFQTLQFFAPLSHFCWHFQLVFLFTCKLAFSSATVPCFFSFMCKRWMNAIFREAVTDATFVNHL